MYKAGSAFIIIVYGSDSRVRSSPSLTRFSFTAHSDSYTRQYVATVEELKWRLLQDVSHLLC